MHPIAIIASRATAIRSAPSAIAMIDRSGEPQLAGADPHDVVVERLRLKDPEHAGEPRSCRAARLVRERQRRRARAPSPPSMLMKSGPCFVSRIRSASSYQKSSCPTADLIPTGRPVAAAISSTNRISPETSSNAAWLFGLMQSSPTGMPRAAAISAVTFVPGSTPPFPGLAPWEIFTSIRRIAGTSSQSCTTRSRSNLPSASRAPKYPVPIWKHRSPPKRW